MGETLGGASMVSRAVRAKLMSPEYCFSIAPVTLEGAGPEIDDGVWLERPVYEVCSVRTGSPLTRTASPCVVDAAAKACAAPNPPLGDQAEK